MPQIRGSQYRESLEEAGYILVKTWRSMAVLADQDGKRELWQRNPDYSGYVVTINGIGYEFICSL